MIYIGEINYLNIFPIYYHLKKEMKIHSELNFLEFIYGTPAFLNNSLKSGNIDIGPSSSFYYILNYRSSLIFRDISISSKKTVKSIYLFSPKPIGNFEGDETIYVTPETLTSLSLLKILLIEIYKFDIDKFNFITLPSGGNFEFKSKFHKMDSKILLHIGNNALKFKREIKTGYYAYDLASLWYEFTGLPFVFALFIIRKDSYYRKQNEFKMLYNYLIKSKEDAVNGFQEAALSILKNEEYNFISYEELIDYWTNALSFDFGEGEIGGFKLYCELLRKNKLINSIPALNFALGGKNM